MDSIIRGTNATIQIKIKEDLDFSTITALELHIYQPVGLSSVEKAGLIGLLG